MPKPTNKADLIKMANVQFDKLWNMVDDVKDAVFCFDAEALTAKDGAAHWKRDKNLRDVLTHLYEWHQLLINWEKANSNGENKPFLPPPYTWKTYAEMNVEFWHKHQSTHLDKAKDQLIESHKQALKIIEKYTDEQLFTKAYYKWTGTSSLGQYCISATASHYDWAIKKLKQHQKTVS